MSSNMTGGEYVPEDRPQYSPPPPGIVPAMIALGDQPTARWNFPAALGTPVTDPGGIGTAASVTFGFLAAPSQQMGDLGYTGFTPLVASQQAGLRGALAAWAEVARLTFTETAGASADIRIARVDQAGGGGFAYYPSYGYSFNGGGTITAVNASPIGGDIFIGNAAGADMAVGGFGYQLALHESGHAIGLKHPFEDPPTLTAATDNLRYTVMSYTAAPNAGTVDVTGTTSSYSWTSYDLQPRTPMLYDIAAAQHLYGANIATRAGDDNYAWADHERFLMTIWDGGGNDTIDASNQTLGNVIDLRDGAFSSIGIRTTQADLRLDIPAFATGVPTPSYDGRDNLAIAFGAVIENANGGAGDDVIHGNTVRNTLRGNDGNDVIHANFLSNGPNQGQGSFIYGGAGNDILYGRGGAVMHGGAGDDQYVSGDYRDDVREVAGEGTDTIWASGSHTAMWQNVEIGRLTGNGSQLQGFGGSQQIVANPGLSSLLRGGDGDDVLWGSLLDNRLEGGAGDDIIRSQGGAGTFKGGAGHDQFVVSKAGTIIEEAVGEGTDTIWITVDGFIAAQNVEIIRMAGTATVIEANTGDEQIVANPLFASTIDASYGNDTIWGSPFADTLMGNFGDDIIRGQGGADVMRGNHGNDQFVVLDNAVIIEELSGQGYDTAWYAVSGMAMAANVERANLSGTANSVAGNASDNVIVGNPTLGNAHLTGGAGNDTLFGGSGADLFRGDAGDDVFYSQGGADRFVYQGPGFGYDQISGFVQGSARIDFTGSGITFANLFLNSAGANTQVEVFGSAILVFNVTGMNAGDFLF